MVIERKHIEEAFKSFDPREVAARSSTKWDVIHPITKERLPPKVILDTAARIAGKLSAKDRNYRGGGWPTNDILTDRGFEVALKPELEASDIAKDILNVVESDADATTKERLVNARLGQGGFRQALIEIWEAQCALTQCGIEPVLRASHIKPWRSSSNVERLDPHNGILLAASIDALFDKFLITFAPDGRVVASASLDRKALARLGVSDGQTIQLRESNQRYMHWHRSEFDRLYGAQAFVL